MTSLNQDMAQKFHKFRVFIKKTLNFLAPRLLFCEQAFSLGGVAQTQSLERDQRQQLDFVFS